VSVPPEGLSFEERLLIAYAAKCDWFQPMDISLPGGFIDADTPMHFGPAVLAMTTAPALLDVVESLIGYFAGVWYSSSVHRPSAAPVGHTSLYASYMEVYVNRGWRSGGHTPRLCVAAW
jgi:hypothetical protein